MNTFLKVVGIVTLITITVVAIGATAVLAQGPHNSMMMGAGEGHGSGMGMHRMAMDPTTMHTAIAEALGISLEEFEAALAEGKTPFTLAQELGVDFAVVQAAMQAAHTTALQQSVTDGLITQEQADWMLSHQAGMGGGMGHGSMGHGGMGNGGGMHQGSGSGEHNGDCPYMP